MDEIANNVNNVPEHNIDPRGRPTVMAGSEHHIHNCRQFVCNHFSKSTKTDPHRLTDCRLAEWIIDDFCLV